MIKDKTFFMKEAIKEAIKGKNEGEVPVGAVVVLESKIISKAHNRVEKENTQNAHAEILALTEAAKKINSWRLNEASIFVTLEPCTMCMGAMILSRIKELYFGCYDRTQGAAGSIYNLSNNPLLPHSIKTYPEFLALESKILLKNFFNKLRK